MADLNIDVGTRPNELGINLGVGTVMGVYTAGEGIWIEDHVINADVTQPELDALAASIPTAKVERVTDGALVTVTDASGTTTAMLHDATIADDKIQEYVRQYIESGGIQLVQTVVDGDLRLSLA